MEPPGILVRGVYKMQGHNINVLSWNRGGQYIWLEMRNHGVHEEKGIKAPELQMRNLK